MNTGAERHPPLPGMHITGRSCQDFPIREDYGMVNVSKEGQVFRCDICGNVVVVKEAGGGELICCGEPMILVE
jgi:desulfoferrodoxin-like iron-binding protein